MKATAIMKATAMPFRRERRSEIRRKVTTSQATILYDSPYDSEAFKNTGQQPSASSAVFLISAGNQTAEDAEDAEEQPDRE